MEVYHLLRLCVLAPLPFHPQPKRGGPIIKTATLITTECYHCGETCATIVEMDSKAFCCEGCKQVYLLLSENNLCSYYNFDKNPGIKATGKFISERFAYLDDAETVQKLVQFSSDTQTNVTFQLPQMHCSSCVFLLENLHRIEPGITKSQTNFQRKEVFIIFNPTQIPLRKVVTLLAYIGYEPAIHLKDSDAKKANSDNKKNIYPIGVAGFCFANIMMLSFPEYFSAGHIELPGLKQTFTWLNLILSLPVLFFSASPIFISAWKGLRQRFLNIDVPLALAITVTFSRSYYEIISGSGAGFLDSGTGIVFFMLIGRWFQNKTYDSFSFDRDYTSYFPLGVTAIKAGIEKNIPVTQLQTGDYVLIRNEEMIPADALLIKGNAQVDYSFVSGEQTLLHKNIGELIYAGGKQMGGAIELQIVKPVSQSYITQLWNNAIFTHKKNVAPSFIHPWSKYFTLSLFTVAIAAAAFWAMHDVHKILPAVTAVLIVACPCSLLLSATFTYGNMLRLFGKNKLYLKNAGVIESLAKTDTIVFDKTGTITHPHGAAISYQGKALSNEELAAVQAIAQQSAHPLSKMIAAHIGENKFAGASTISNFSAVTGKGSAAIVNDRPIKIGAANFVHPNALIAQAAVGAQIHVAIGETYKGAFFIATVFRAGIEKSIGALLQQQYDLHLLSGDNDAAKNGIHQLMGLNSTIAFNQSPQDKLDAIQQLQTQHKKVLMIGDGLNDAGALMQSDTGIAVSDNAAQFSPACDAIIDGSKVGMLHQFLAFAKSGKTIVTVSFILSILYNIVGLSFAVQGTLSPIVAAILMPTSSISIVLLVTLLSSLSAKRLGLAT